MKFFEAIEEGDLAAVRASLDAEPDLVNRLGTSPRWRKGECTPLQLAVECGEREVASELLDRGADIDAQGTLHGWAPLHLALKNRGLAEYLVARGAAVDIYAAAGLGDVAALSAIVRRDPEAVTRRGPDGATALHFAANADVAEFLIGAGAQVDALDEEHHMTPLGWLAANREVADLLVSRGAPVATPFLAAAVGHAAAMRRFLEEDRSVISAVTPEGDYYGGGATLLHLAAANGHTDIARLLLESGASVNARGGWFNATPLHWAAQGGWVETAALLLEHGADLSVQDTGYEGTPLDWAEHFEQLGVIELLKRAVVS